MHPHRTLARSPPTHHHKLERRYTSSRLHMWTPFHQHTLHSTSHNENPGSPPCITGTWETHHSQCLRTPKHWTHNPIPPRSCRLPNKEHLANSHSAWQLQHLATRHYQECEKAFPTIGGDPTRTHEKPMPRHTFQLVAQHIGICWFINTISIKLMSAKN